MTTTDEQREAARAQARAKAAERQKRERNWKRIILIGALAGFTSLLGVVSIQDGVSGNVPGQPAISSQPDDTQQVVIRRVRTRSS